MNYVLYGSVAALILVAVAWIVVCVYELTFGKDEDWL